MTEEFWQKSTNYYRYISTLVKDEIETSSIEIKNDLFGVIYDFEILNITTEVEELADEYMNKGIVLDKFRNDAVHIAVAVINNIDFLISWNFRHLVKVKTRKIVNLINELLGYPHIEIIAPPEL